MKARGAGRAGAGRGAARLQGAVRRGTSGEVERRQAAVGVGVEEGQQVGDALCARA